MGILYSGAELLLKNNQVRSFIANHNFHSTQGAKRTIFQLLLSFAQHTSGADLANLLVDVLIKSKEAPSEEHFEKLTR